jgi:hypothetical protein
LARLDLSERPHGSDRARIVESDVQAAKCRVCGSNCLIVRARFGDVSKDGERATTMIFDFIDRRLQRRFPPGNEHDGRTMRGK